MIRLVVEDYCQSCAAFSPVSNTTEYRDIDNPIAQPVIIQTTVKCEYAKRCAGIARHIRSEMGKKLESEGQNNDRES